MIFDQSDFDIRCEWGAVGVAQLAPISDVVVIVDVLSFSTCVEIALTRGATIVPFSGDRASARTYAKSVRAKLAGTRTSRARFTLSPHSLLEIPNGTRLVLPTPNGSTLTLAAGKTPTLTGCLRNARAVAFVASKLGKRIAVIPAGERWQDGSTRFALEDWLGAGAILENLNGRFSPEAQAARATFRRCKAQLATLLAQCNSGQELIAKNFARDVALASEWNASFTVPQLRNGEYRENDWYLDFD